MTDLALTLLTGRRPRLLVRTLRSIERHAAKVLRAAHVTAFVNGGDPESLELVRSTKWIDDVLHGTELLGIGASVSHLWQRAGVGQREYLMHLEDDWECCQEWLQPALTILERERQVGQVRLRRHVPQSAVGHAVMRYHMVTGRPLKWTKPRPHGTRYLTARAHLTFNPSLLRGSVAASVIPCESELDAARRYHATQLFVAQWIPGAFTHIGGVHSLRETQGRE